MLAERTSALETSETPLTPALSINCHTTPGLPSGGIPAVPLTLAAWGTPLQPSHHDNLLNQDQGQATLVKSGPVETILCEIRVFPNCEVPIRDIATTGHRTDTWAGSCLVRSAAASILTLIKISLNSTVKIHNDESDSHLMFLNISSHAHGGTIILLIVAVSMSIGVWSVNHCSQFNPNPPGQAQILFIIM